MCRETFAMYWAFGCLIALGLCFVFGFEAIPHALGCNQVAAGLLGALSGAILVTPIVYVTFSQ